MKYGQIEKAYFESRPNRFIAYVDRLSQQENVHVKNTGRCRELLLPGAEVYLARGSEDKKEERKTKYDLVAVKKGERIINMDSRPRTRPFMNGFWKRSCFRILYQ